ncbi:MAG: type III polyketide synthase, partial [Bacteroidetes bacterium]|nr:type III polyketide synthase [Bacteroidota bacterium]
MRNGSENKSTIISIGTAVPDFVTNQDTILEFMQYAYDEPVASRKLDVLFNHSGIDKRYSVIPDFCNQGVRELFPETQEIPPLNERVELYKEKALPLAVRAVQRSLKNIHSSLNDIGITHLITVTCTGLYAPGLDAELMEQLNLSP